MDKRERMEFASGFGELSDTIAAIATPLGQGGIGIVRMSGPRAHPIADQIFHGKIIPSRAKSHTVHHGWIFDAHHNRRLDEVLLLLMRSPHSYTTEDMVEICCHCGVYILRRVLQLLLDHGARLARPGEFTLRAFLHGRLDLAQAEAVVDLVSASSEEGVAVALDQLGGRLSSEVEDIREQLVQVLVQVEAAIDFPDDELELVDGDALLSSIDVILKRVRRLLDSFERGRMVREGVRVAIVGRTNVGKSSLLNALLERERAIVTSMPGTTRDTVEGFIRFEGMAIHLVDTAGLRLPRDQVEEEGIRRSKFEVNRADLILLVIDSSTEIQREDFDILREIAGKRVIVVINKIDLPQRFAPGQLVIGGGGLSEVQISATEGWGLASLREAIVAEIVASAPSTPEGMILTSLRHHDSLRQAEKALVETRNSMTKKVSGEFVALDLRAALSALGEIVGETVTDEILEQIFEQFCVGK